MPCTPEWEDFDPRGGEVMSVVAAKAGAGNGQTSPVPAAPARPQAGRHVRRRILVVDDDESSRAGLASLLSTWGHHVQEAEDGRQALDRAAAFRPAVIVTDLVMPGL